MKRLALVVLALVASPAVHAQSCTSGNPTTLGVVKVVNTTCSKGNKPVGTTCHNVTVACTGIPTISAELRVYPRAKDTKLRGTVVIGTGGGGTGFYYYRTGGPELIADLQKLGFRVVDRLWKNGGWFSSKTSIRKQSCRYATLLTWIHKNIHTTGAFCATGNSGGSAEIGYALSTWGRGDILDVAVPTGGPPMARLDYLCIQSAAWTKLCATLVPEGRSDCRKVACNIGSHLVCNGCGSNPTAAQLREDSILHTKATLSYPKTRLHIVLGTRDCGSAVPNGLLFYNAVTSEKVLEFAPGSPHWTPGTMAGREAIVRAILGGIACRPGSFNVPKLPKVGGKIVLDIRGMPSKSYLIYAAEKTGRLELGVLGWVFLQPPLIAAGGGKLNAQGRGTYSVNVPNDKSLTGLAFFAQLAAGTCITNVVQVKILP